MSFLGSEGEQADDLSTGSTPTDNVEGSFAFLVSCFSCSTQQLSIPGVGVVPPTASDSAEHNSMCETFEESSEGRELGEDIQHSRNIWKFKKNIYNKF